MLQKEDIQIGAIIKFQGLMKNHFLIEEIIEMKPDHSCIVKILESDWDSYVIGTTHVESIASLTTSNTSQFFGDTYNLVRRPIFPKSRFELINDTL